LWYDSIVWNVGYVLEQVPHSTPPSDGILFCPAGFNTFQCGISPTKPVP
jgi:hypothetical protein